MLGLSQISYWKQFEHGMLSREAVRKLGEMIDVATDTEGAFMDTVEIRKTWEVKGIYAYMVRIVD